MNRILLPKLDPCDLPVFALSACQASSSEIGFRACMRWLEKCFRRVAAASGGFHGKLIDFNANFSHTYSFVYFEIVHIVEATYSENMKPMCQYNQL